MFAGEGIAGIEQPVVERDDLFALALEGVRDLGLGLFGVARVDAAQHAEDEHVLAPARVRHDLQAGLLDRQLVHDQAVLPELGNRLGILVTDLGHRVFAPFVLEQHRGPFLVGPVGDARIENLLVEGDDDVCLVTHVGDIARCEADADAAGPGGGACGRLDLGGDDLDGPDTVAHFGADRAEGLTGLLRAFSRVADDLDDVLVDGQGLCRRRGGLGAVDHVTPLHVFRRRRYRLPPCLHLGSLRTAVFGVWLARRSASACLTFRLCRHPGNGRTNS